LTPPAGSDDSTGQQAYSRFWSGVGRTFPDLGGAASTTFYRENEERLFLEHLPPLCGLRVLKTDLWDEAKNTRILLWAAEQGASIHGLDISEPTARLAREAEPRGPRQFVVADCRHIPYATGSFDAVYSMGTIEHFDESDAAVREICRVLKPGGRAIVGVPNRLDPFLRPLLVVALSAVGLYGYGFEKSYTRGALRRMMTSSGFSVVAETAILFMPGWLRMLDLACHAWARPLTLLTGAMVKLFVLIDRHVPSVRRHGYLIVAVGEKK
jgi:SAM-dependent methyltransferase